MLINSLLDPKKVKYANKIILHSLTGYRSGLDALIEDFKNSGVKFVGVVGIDASNIEDIIDELCVGDGSDPYEMLTSSHEEETLEEAVELAETLGSGFSGEVQVVKF